jgi:hypothetical protein
MFNTSFLLELPCDFFDEETVEVTEDDFLVSLVFLFDLDFG